MKLPTICPCMPCSSASLGSTIPNLANKLWVKPEQSAPLTRDVPPQTVLECALNTGCRLVGLSALMTTTVPAMEETIRLLREKAPFCKIVVGGAVLTKEYADKIGADRYAKDALDTVRYAEEVISEKA